MTGLSTIHVRTCKLILATVAVAIVGTGIPVIEVHAHDDPAFGHGHDAHVHSHGPSATPAPDHGDDPKTADADDIHAHIVCCTAVALTAVASIDITIPAYGRNQIPPPVSQPPDKPVRPLYRPPIA